MKDSSTPPVRATETSRAVRAVHAAPRDAPAVRTVYAAVHAEVHAALDDDGAVLVPTSGSTGAPRTVQVSGRALRASGTATAARLGGHGTWLLALPTSHVAGLQVVARSVLAGTEPVVLDPAGGFRGLAFADAARRVRGARRYTSLVPTQVHRLLAEAHGGDTRGLDALATFDAVLLGGAATPPSTQAALREAGVRVVTTYGMSETAGGCVYDGRPLDGVDVRVVDGRVHLGGPVLADGYAGDPAATAEVFVPDTAGRRWFRTSDLGRLDADGTLTVLGRADDVLITGGVNVAPAAVEAVLAGQAGLGEVCVVGLPDPEWGQVVVAVVTRPGGAPDVPGDGAPDVSDATLLAEVRARVTDTLGAPAAPRHVVVTDALALRGPGKVDRRAVALLAAHRLGRPAATSDR